MNVCQTAVDGVFQTARTSATDQAVIRMNEAEVYDLLETCGISACSHAILSSAADPATRRVWADHVSQLAGPESRIVLKVLGRSILHKSDVGGVRVVTHGNNDDPALWLVDADAMCAEAVRNGCGDDIEGVLAAAFVPHAANQPGSEVLLSIKQDPAFGPVIIVGIGGVLTEWYGHGTEGRSRIILPAVGLDEQTIRTAIENHPLLSILCCSSRLHAEPPVSCDHLVDVLLRLATLAVATAADCAGDTLEELEINPAVACGGVLVALDGVGLLSRRTSLPGRRPLHRISNLLEPRSAVVLGVSARSVNPGRIILNNLLRSPGIGLGRLYVIHPEKTDIDGVPCVSSLSGLPEKVDLAVICIPAEGARDAIREIVTGNLAESIILIPGGFAEAGHADLAFEIESTLAEGHLRTGQGPVMVGGNCLGIVSRDQYNTFFLPDYKLPFRPADAGANLALVSQSGAYLVTFSSNYNGRIYPRASISYGNQMDLTVTDFLEHFRTVAGVDVIACYIEGFREGDGLRFLSAARAAAKRGQTVLVFKAGKTPLGAKAAASHTASLAGDYDIALSCLEGAGVVVAETLDEFEDLIKTFTLLHDKVVSGRSTGILSNAGFECSTVTDALAGLELATFGPEILAALDASLPPFAHRANPVDATPMASTAAYDAAVMAIAAGAEVDAMIISAVPVTPALNNLPVAPGVHREDLAGPDSQASSFVRHLGASRKPAVVVVDSGAMYDPLAEAIESQGIPVFRKIDRASRSLARFVSVKINAEIGNTHDVNEIGEM